MGRIRTIKPEFYTHKGLGQLEPLTRILFSSLWTMADKEGRLEDIVPVIKGNVLPFDDCEIQIDVLPRLLTWEYVNLTSFVEGNSVVIYVINTFFFAFFFSEKNSAPPKNASIYCLCGGIKGNIFLTIFCFPP